MRLKRITTRVKEYMTAFLVLETLMVGTFSALDLVLFYLFFEGGLIPMFLIIGVWGGPRRVYASFKFFLYTLLGSVLMLLAIMAMYWDAGTTDIPTLLRHDFPRGLQTWAWLAFFASFAVKMPMWPVSGRGWFRICFRFVRAAMILFAGAGNAATAQSMTPAPNQSGTMKLVFRDIS